MLLRMRIISMTVLSAVVAIAACSLDGLKFDLQDHESASTSAGGVGGAGGLMTGGGEMVCEPGSVEPCYSGPIETMGVGTCRAGVHTCLPDGAGYSACEGEVLPGSQLCGADADCDGQFDYCQPDVLVETPQPWFLAIDPTTDYIYWTKRGFGSPGGVYRSRKDGTNYELLFANEGDPRGIAVNGDGIFWVVDDGLRFGSKSGGGASYVWSAPPYYSPEWEQMVGSSCGMPFFSAVAVDAAYVFWTLGGYDCPGAFMLPLGGGAQVSILAPGDTAEGMAVDDQWIFFSGGGGSFRMNKTDQSILVLSQDYSEGIAVDATHVYLQEFTQLLRVEKDGSNPTVLSTWANCGAGHYPFNVAVDDTHVYWLEQCSGTVRRMHKLNLNEETVWEGATCLMSIVVDADAVYWSECDDAGRIMVMPKF